MRSTFAKYSEASDRGCLSDRFARGTCEVWPRQSFFYFYAHMPKRFCYLAFPPITAIYSYPQPFAFLIPAESLLWPPCGRAAAERCVPKLQQSEIIEPADVACHIGELGCGLGCVYWNQSVSRVIAVCHWRASVCGV